MVKHKRRAFMAALVLLLGSIIGLKSGEFALGSGQYEPAGRFAGPDRRGLEGQPGSETDGGASEPRKRRSAPPGPWTIRKSAFTMKDIPVDTWAMNRDPMTQKMLELSQKFPFPGKRRLRSEVAAEQTHSDEYTYQDKVNEVRAKVVVAYWGLSMAYTAIST